MDLLSKPADEIGPADIETLVASRLPESERVEFKRALPAAKGKRDPWYEDRDPGDKAKNGILEEVVAFANAYGGLLVLGIGESSDRPPVASEIVPVPRCTDLTERFKLVFRDCVEPPLSGLEIFAVPTKGDNGVVLFRVGRSLLAPHRVTKTLVCPVRRADRCEKMTMREIQDMTLNVSRGIERLERQLSERSRRFHNEFDCLSDPGNAYGLRFTAVPVNDDIRIDRFFREGHLIDKFDFNWKIILGNGGKIRNSLRPLIWKPIVRGARSDSLQKYDGDRKLDTNDYYEIHQVGLIEFGFVSVLGGLNIRYRFSEFYALFGNLVVWAHNVKCLSSAINSEYTIEVEIYVKSPSGTAIVEPREYFSYGGNVTLNSIKFPPISSIQIKQEMNFCPVSIEI